MLNLSDKDLDRLSQEAAQHYDPEDIGDLRSWEKLEMRLDRDLGRISPNPARGIRRLPFYYAPALLVLFGLSYYFIRLNNKAPKGVSSGSPPATVVKSAPTGPINPSSSQNAEKNDHSNSTLTVPPKTTRYPVTAQSEVSSTHAPGVAVNAPAVAVNAPATIDHAAAASKTRASGSTLASIASDHSTAVRSHTTPSAADIGAKRHRNGNRHNQPKPQSSVLPEGPVSQGSAMMSRDAATQNTAIAREASLSTVRGPLSLKGHVSISDSALRALNLKSLSPQLIVRKGSLHINRSLQLGLMIAPDFSSVNSVAGDRPGSSIGLTADYQFGSHWYVGTGLLFSRKNYGAAAQDYHVPTAWYLRNNISNVEYVKGSFNMLEIPLNLRYDFSTTGNTLFFASIGASSYLATSESCNYYYNSYGRPYFKGFQYPGRPSYLFSAVTLSVGVETGISNSMSLLIAPYMKVPSRNIGFGQIEMSSFGINFALKFAPVLSRKR